MSKKTKAKKNPFRKGDYVVEKNCKDLRAVYYVCFVDGEDIGIEASKKVE